MNFDGMWADPDSDPREALEPGMGEKVVLAEYLDRYRMTFELKCEGLTAEQGSQLKGVRDAGAPWLDL
jgi:hypothetical protein